MSPPSPSSECFIRFSIVWEEAGKNTSLTFLSLPLSCQVWPTHLPCMYALPLSACSLLLCPSPGYWGKEGKCQFQLQPTEPFPYLSVVWPSLWTHWLISFSLPLFLKSKVEKLLFVLLLKLFSELTSSRKPHLIKESMLCGFRAVVVQVRSLD